MFPSNVTFYFLRDRILKRKRERILSYRLWFCLKMAFSSWEKLTIDKCFCFYVLWTSSRNIEHQWVERGWVLRTKIDDLKIWASLLFASKYSKSSSVWIWKIDTLYFKATEIFHLELNGHVCEVEGRIIGEQLARRMEYDDPLVRIL